MATKSKGQSARVAVAQQLITGTSKRLAPGTQVLLQGSSLTPAEVSARLARIVTLRSDVDAAKATLQAKLAAEQAEAPGLQTFVGAYTHFLKAAYGGQPDALADFGIHPKDPTPLTVEAKLAATAKRAATRAARGTMGPKAKLKIKGDVTGVTITPVTSPSADPPR